MKNIISNIIFSFARAFSHIYSYPINKLILSSMNMFYSGWISREFKSFGKGSVIERRITLRGGKHISIGCKCSIGSRSIIAAWNRHGVDQFDPKIIIGNHVSIGEDSHITSINRIEINNHVLTGKKITISDHNHGESDLESLSIPPNKRPLRSKGPVIIEEGVWIGDKVTILQNVRIGRRAIIAANSVVTSDIPENCVAAGIPARVIGRKEPNEHEH